MAELTIAVHRTDGKLVIRVGLLPDDDDLPHEHEARHRRLVAALFPSLRGAEVGRERPAREAAVG
jgi:hypothetical protein